MTIRIGYACINTTLPSTSRTCRLKNATAERIVELGRLNLIALGEVLNWNITHQVRVFRISSEVIPLASHPAVTTPWWDELRPELEQVGSLVRSYGLRVSMHPGQFTVLSSPRQEVVEASQAELVYHARFLDALGLDQQHKIILHLGGVYGDREAALQRFIQRYQGLPGVVRQRLVVENDEKNYTLADALEVSKHTGAPVVFDVFHHSWNPSLHGLSLRGLGERAAQTWKPADGRPKLHYSDPWPGKRPGSHSRSVDVQAFAEFYEQVRDMDLDVMLEVKDKEQSVLALHKVFPELAREEA
jgi:UV DNA damage endonuclease